MFVGRDHKIVVQSTPRTSNPLQLNLPLTQSNFYFLSDRFLVRHYWTGLFSSPAYVCKVGKNESTEVKEAVKIL